MTAAARKRAPLWSIVSAQTHNTRSPTRMATMYVPTAGQHTSLPPSPPLASVRSSGPGGEREAKARLTYLSPNERESEFPSPPRFTLPSLLPSLFGRPYTAGEVRIFCKLMPSYSPAPKVAKQANFVDDNTNNAGFFPSFCKATGGLSSSSPSRSPSPLLLFRTLFCGFPIHRKLGAIKA